MLVSGITLRKDTRKVGLDPVFGLAATRDSKAMDSARTRNMTYDKRLKTLLQSLEESASVRHVKIITRQAKTKEMLEKINPDPDKKIVTPIGLSEQQVKTVRLLRRGSLPSMSVHELEHRLTEIRSERQCGTTTLDSGSKTDKKPTRKSRNEFTEFKIKRKLYPGISKTKEPRADTVKLVANNHEQTWLPLYRRKSLVGEAFQRITSSDVIHSGDRNRDGQRRCQSDSDISMDSSSLTYTNGNQQSSGPVNRRTNASWRRNTIPDVKTKPNKCRKSSTTNGQTSDSEHAHSINGIPDTPRSINTFPTIN